MTDNNNAKSKDINNTTSSEQLHRTENSNNEERSDVCKGTELLARLQSDENEELISSKKRKRNLLWDKKWFQQLREQQIGEGYVRSYSLNFSQIRRGKLKVGQVSKNFTQSPSPRKSPVLLKKDKKEEHEVLLQESENADFCLMSLLPASPPEITEEVRALPQSVKPRESIRSPNLVKRRIVVRRTSPPPPPPVPNVSTEQTVKTTFSIH